MAAWGAAGLSLCVLWAFLTLPFFQTYLHMRPIEVEDWYMVGITTLAVYLFETWRKSRLRRQEKLT
jgi:hypothetical protein